MSADRSPDAPRNHDPATCEPADAAATQAQPALDDTGERMFGTAIAATLRVEPDLRAATFEKLAAEIHEVTHAPGCGLRPWTCSVHDGVDGSRIFRGGLGASLVIDPAGRLWRARNVEDFDTTYTISVATCEIATLTPKYGQMRQYLSRSTDSRAAESRPTDSPANAGS